MFRRALAIAIVSVLNLSAQDPVAAAQQWRIEHQAEILDGFTSLLSIPNVAADPTNLNRNASTLIELLRERHITTRLLSLPGVPPIVFGEQKVAGATHTIVFYAHYDGQPVTLSEWQNPPFSPLLKNVDGEQRIYARSAGDDKAAIYAQLAAPMHSMLRTFHCARTFASFGKERKKPVRHTWKRSSMQIAI